jgi:hypothetical protein
MVNEAVVNSEAKAERRSAAAREAASYVSNPSTKGKL